MAISVIVFYISHHQFTENINRDIKERAEEYLVDLAAALQNPLWNFDESGVAAIGAGYTRNELIDTLRIEDAEGNILFQLENDENIPLFLMERTIIHNDVTVGHIHLGASAAHMKEVEKQFFWTFLPLVIGVLIATLFMTSLVMRLFFRRPFGHFVNLVQNFSKGDDAAFARGSPYIEFQPLVAVLKEMGDVIADQMRTLRDSQMELAVAQRIARFGSWKWNIQTGDLTWSEELYGMFGVDPERTRPTYDLYFSFVHPEDRQALREELDRAIVTFAPFSGDHRFLRADGKERWIHAQGETFRDENGAPSHMVGTAHDITERKKTEETIRRLNESLEVKVEERTRDLLEEKRRAENYLNIAGTVIVALDSEGRIDLINDKGAALLGHDKKALIGRDWFEMALPSDEREKVRATFGRIMAGEIKPLEFYENHVVVSDGGRRLVSWQNTLVRNQKGEITGTLSAGMDITDQRAAQKQVLDLLQINSAVFEGSPVGIVVYGRDGECVSANEAVGKIIGATTEQVLSQNFHEIASWKESGMYAMAMETLSSGVAMRGEFQVTTTFGKPIFVDCYFMPIIIHNERRLLFMLNDMTENVKIRTQLIQASKMATLGELATGVAHELNQPLNVIRLATNNMKNELSANRIDPDYISGKLEKMERQIDRAAGVIDHMRIFGRTSDKTPEVVDLREAINGVKGLIGEQLRLADIDLRLDFPDRCRPILGHRVQVEQVLLNLLGNARDALQDNQKKEEKRVTVSLDENNESVRIIVEDNGGGIP
ncbi:MAG: PAS domain S-box protein, partial [Rhodospirillales bacterium]|nr:PAS domain S-box protein [Rhodospirillales bacterium]